MTEAGKYLKNQNLIKWFDLIIIDGRMILKTCRGQGRARQYQYINVEDAMQIIPNPPVEELSFASSQGSIEYVVRCRYVSRISRA